MTAILLPWTGKTINIAHDRLELTFDHKQPFKISPEDCMFDESLLSIFIVFWYHMELRPFNICSRTLNSPAGVERQRNTSPSEMIGYMAFLETYNSDKFVNTSVLYFSLSFFVRIACPQNFSTTILSQYGRAIARYPISFISLPCIGRFFWRFL